MPFDSITSFLGIHSMGIEMYTKICVTTQSKKAEAITTTIPKQNKTTKRQTNPVHCSVIFNSKQLETI